MNYSDARSLFSRFRATSALSGIVTVFVQMLVFCCALGIGGAVLFIIVPIAGTFATILCDRKTPANREPPRDWRNAVANAGLPTLFAIAILLDASIQSHRMFSALIVSGLAMVLADTLSHEFGAAFGGVPRRVTTFEKVSPGVDGGVSLLGSLVMLSVSFSFPLLGAALGLIVLRDLLPIATAAVLGNLLDSVLGATMQRRGWLTNNLVNSISVLSTSACIFYLLR